MTIETRPSSYLSELGKSIIGLEAYQKAKKAGDSEIKARGKQIIQVIFPLGLNIPKGPSAPDTVASAIAGGFVDASILEMMPFLYNTLSTKETSWLVVPSLIAVKGIYNALINAIPYSPLQKETK
jgi:hypothetical protein